MSGDSKELPRSDTGATLTAGNQPITASKDHLDAEKLSSDPDTPVIATSNKTVPPHGKRPFLLEFRSSVSRATSD